MKTAVVQSQASADPPDTDDSHALYRFFWKRGNAARIMGRLKQRVSDLAKAAKFAKEALGPQSTPLTRILWDLSFAYEAVGEIRNTIFTFERSLEAIPDEKRTQYGANYELYRHAAIAFAYTQLGEMAAAERHMRKAKALHNDHLTRDDFSGKSLATMAARMMYSESKIAFVKGELNKAEDLRRRSLEIAKTFGSKSSQAFNLYHLSNILLHMGRFEEAEVHARESLRLILEYGGGIYPSTAYFIYGLGRVLAIEGRAEEAEALAQAAMDNYAEFPLPEDSLPMAALRGILARAHFLQGNWAQAAEQYFITQNAFGPNSDLRTIVPESRLTSVAILIKVSEYRDALELARKIERVFRERGEAARTLINLAVGLQGAALEAMGAYREAFELFETIRPMLVGEEEDWGLVTGENVLFSRHREIIGESYLRVLEKIQPNHGTTFPETAFQVAEWLRSSSVSKTLAFSSARSLAADFGLGQKLRELQDLEIRRTSQMEGLNSQLRQPKEFQDSEIVTGLKNEADKLSSQIKATQLEIVNQYPDYVEAISPKVPDLGAIREMLREGDTLIATYVSEDRIYVWAVPQAGPISFAIVPIARSTLKELVSQVRVSVTPEAETWGDIPEFDLAAAYTLFKTVLDPVRKGWKDASHLIVVLHRSLGNLPFSMLPLEFVALDETEGFLFSKYRDVPWLVRKYAVSVLPSTSALRSLRKMAASRAAQNSFAGFGNPCFDPSGSCATEGGNQDTSSVSERPPFRSTRFRNVRMTLRGSLDREDISSVGVEMLSPLPETEKEIIAVAESLGASLERDVFLGVEANETNVKSTDLSDRRIIIFATHGLVPGDLDGLLEPALALASPLAAKVEGDGLLTMGEIFNLRLDADWVVLSACNTAAADGKGVEAVSGLGRAFFYAGARALAVTHWPVETTSAQAFTTALFRNQVENPLLSRAQALRQTMISMIDGPGLVDSDSGEGIVSYAHPMFWAPFSLIGDGGGNTLEP